MWHTDSRWIVSTAGYVRVSPLAPRTTITATSLTKGANFSA